MLKKQYFIWVQSLELVIRTKFTALVLILTAAAVGCDSTPESPTLIGASGPGGSPHGIVGPTWQDWEFAAGVVAFFPHGGLCTGTLIDPQVVLTAGHCVKVDDGIIDFDYTTDPESLDIVAGPVASTAPSIGTPIEIRTHPGWTGDIQESQRDLALILLDAPVTDIEPFGLRDFPAPEIGDSGWLVGYGEDDFGDYGTQLIGETTVQDVTTTHIEVGDPTNICGGDSGGPLLTQVNEEWVVTGVVSFGSSLECSETEGGFFVNLLGNCHWLNTVMLEWTGHDLGLEECAQCELAKAQDWGQGCGPDLPDCPEGSICMNLAGSGVPFGYGFCSPECCLPGSSDPDYCFDVADGEEKCVLGTGENEHYCAILCDNDLDCPEYAECINIGICMAPGPDSDSDSDTDSDSDSGVDTDSETDAGPAASDSNGDCGCHTAGVNPWSPGSLLKLIASILR